MRACARWRLRADSFFILCQNRDSDRQVQGLSLCLTSSLIPLCLCTHLQPRVFIRHTHSSLHGPAKQPPPGQPGPAPIALLPVHLFNQIHAHAHTLDRKRRDRQRAHIYQNLPRKPFFASDITTHDGSRPHSHQAPVTPHLCCSRLLCAPRSAAEQSLSSACHKLPEGFNESTVQTNLYRAKIRLVSHSSSFWHRTAPGFHIPRG